jgi:tetratricopeptide (TPR) repeat protein
MNLFFANVSERFGLALPLQRALLVTMLCVTALHAQTTSAEDVRARMDAKQYQEALKLIAPALTKVRTDDMTGQRFALLAMRGECLLQIGQYATAASAFETAVKSAPEIRAAAMARANALLIKGSQNGKYASKATPGAAPIDIVNPESRRLAFAAIREDRIKPLQPRIDAAMNGTALNPMLELLNPVMDVGYFEFAANGNAAETKQILINFGARARELIQNEFKRLSREMDVMEDASNSTVDYTRRGLYSTERDALTQNVAYLQKIAQTARDARRRARELGMDGAAWEPIIADAQELIDNAQALLNVQG